MGAVAASAFVRNMPRTRALMPFVLYPVLAGTDLACIHAELKVVQLKTINKVRARVFGSPSYLKDTVIPSRSPSSDRYIAIDNTYAILVA